MPAAAIGVLGLLINTVIRPLIKAKDHQMHGGMPLRQQAKHGDQTVKALLMGFGSHSQEHLLVSSDIPADQPSDGVGIGREPGQRPGHGVGQTELGMRLQMLGQPATRGFSLHKMQLGPWVSKPPQQPPGPTRPLQRGEVPFRDDAWAGHAPHRQQQLDRRQGGHAENQIRLMAPQPCAQPQHAKGKTQRPEAS